MNDDSSSKKSILIFVHGTFANKDGVDPTPEQLAEEGEEWWQSNSELWHQFKAALEPHNICPAGDPCFADKNGQIPEHLRTFRWSSGNTERDRHEGAMDLLNRLVQLEKEGRDYHLIGHSHGGSVIWNALVDSVERRWESRKDAKTLELNHLKSWSTVGTPFLHFRNARLIGGWLGKFLTMGFLVMVLMVIGFGSYLLFLQNNENLSEAIAQLRSPKRSVPAEVAEVGASSGNAGFQDVKGMAQGPANEGGNVLKEDPAVDKAQFSLSKAKEELEQSSLLELLGFLLLFIFGLVLLWFIPFAIYLSIRAQRVEARMVWRETRAKNQAMLEFGNRWLGLWARQDEAISGLRSSLKLKGEVVPRVKVPRRKIFKSDGVIRVNRFVVGFFFAPIYNRFIRSIGDAFIWSNLSKGAQGANRPGCKLVDVTEGPILLKDKESPTGLVQYLSLPEDVDAKLTDDANDAIGARAGEVMSITRRSLSSVAWGPGEISSLLNGVSAHLTSAELIHTSYFQNPSVIGALMRNVAPENPPVIAEESPSVESWVPTFRQEVQQKLQDNWQIKKRGLPRLGRRNWLALFAFGAGFVVPAAVLVLAIVVQALGGFTPGWVGFVGCVILPIAAFICALIALPGSSKGARCGWAARTVPEFVLFMVMLVCGTLGAVSIYGKLFEVWSASPVANTVVSSDGETIVTSFAQTIRVWNADGTVVRDFYTPGLVNAMDLTKEGDAPKLVAAMDNSIIVYDLDGEIIRSFDPKAHRGGITSVQFSPDARQILSCGMDRKALLWNLSMDTPIATLGQHHRPIREAEFSPDGRWVATACYDGKVRLWNTTTRKMVDQDKLHGSPVMTLAFSPDGTMLATGDSKGTVHLWSISPDGLNHLHKLREPQGAIVVDLEFAPDNLRLAIAISNMAYLWDKVEVWNLGEEAGMERVYEHLDIRSVAFTPDGEMLTTDSTADQTADPLVGFVDIAYEYYGNGHSVVKKWKDDEIQFVYDQGDYQVHTVGFSRDDRYIIGAVGKRHSILWDRQRKTWEHAHQTYLNNASVHPRVTSYVATSDQSRQVLMGWEDQVSTTYLWEIQPNTRELVHLAEFYGSAVLRVEPLPNSASVVMSYENQIQIYDPADDSPTARRNLIGEEEAASTYINAYTCHPSGEFLAVYQGGTLLFRDVNTGQGEVVRGLSQEEAEKLGSVGLIFSSDGNQLLTFWVDTFELWDVDSRERLKSFPVDYSTFGPNSNYQVRYYAIRPDGKQFAYYADWSVVLVDMETGEQRSIDASAETGLTFPNQISSVAFSQDGSALAVGCFGENLLVFDTRSGALIENYSTAATPLVSE